MFSPDEWICINIILFVLHLRAAFEYREMLEYLRMLPVKQYIERTEALGVERFTIQ